MSFFGGGTDYPVWFLKNSGKVLGTTINKYCYVTLRTLPSFFKHKYSISYSKLERVNEIDELEHPVFRECMRFFNVKKGLEIHYDADLPGRSGLGSSSSFVVSLLNCLKKHELGANYNTKKLAEDAIYVEQELIGDDVGNQDQIHAAYGGFNCIEFKKNKGFSVEKLGGSSTNLKNINRRLLLFHTGIQRFASNVAQRQIAKTPLLSNELRKMAGMVDTAKKIIQGPTKDLDDFGHLLHESWLLKRSLTSRISNNEIDNLYQRGLNVGAIGGKLLGAGGGGFILFYSRKKYHQALLNELSELTHVPFTFEKEGSKIIYSDR